MLVRDAAKKRIDEAKSQIAKLNQQIEDDSILCDPKKSVWANVPEAIRLLMLKGRLTFDSVAKAAKQMNINFQRDGRGKYEAWVHDSSISECKTLAEVVTELQSLYFEREKCSKTSCPNCQKCQT